MPRYFFNILEGHSQNLVRDIEGALLSGAREARKEALGLARDITRHGIHGPTQTWTVIVTDEKGDEVLTVPLSGGAARKTRGAFGLGARFARLEAGISRGTIVWLVGAALLATSVQAVISTVRLAQQQDGYQTASAAPESSTVAVRFAAQASMADVGKFLGQYQAAFAGGPQPGNLYRLRIGDTALPPDQLAKIVRQMTQEKIVEFVAAVQ